MRVGEEGPQALLAPAHRRPSRSQTVPKPRCFPPRPHVLRARTLVGAALPAQNTHSSGKCGIMLRTKGAATGAGFSTGANDRMAYLQDRARNVIEVRAPCWCKEGRGRQRKVQRTRRRAERGGEGALTVVTAPADLMACLSAR